VIKNLITKCSTLYLRSWRLLSRRACGFACVVITRTSEGLAGPRVLEVTVGPKTHHSSFDDD